MTVEREGWEGWNEYAPFYDWENARTLGRRDVAFWRRVATASGGYVLELGAGTGRVAIPLAEAGVRLVGVDRSGAMLRRAVDRAGSSAAPPRFVRGDIRALPFAANTFSTVIAPYGVLQSLLTDRDLRRTLESVAGVLRPGGRLGIDLVPDVPKWREYNNRVQLRGRAPGGVQLTLVESVRQDRRRRRTTFEQRYVERRRGETREHTFELTFRTVSVRGLAKRLERSGFRVDAILGDYQGRPWDERADVWIVLATRTA